MTHVLHWAVALGFLAVLFRPWRWFKPAPAIGDDRPSLSDHVKRHGARIGAAGFFWTLAGWRSLREGSLRPLVHHAEWRAAWRVARALAIVAGVFIGAINTIAHAEESIVQFHGGVATPAQEFKSQDWRDTVRADQERAWQDALAYCRENPGLCTYHNVPLKDR
jgi:hypothetical protein